VRRISGFRREEILEIGLRLLALFDGTDRFNVGPGWIQHYQPFPEKELRMRFFVNSQRMKNLTTQSLGAAALMVGLSGVALADNDCTLKTLRGSYVFAASGYNLVSGVAQPKTIVEVIDFNGDGTLSVPAATRSVNGVIARTPPGGTGSYTVNLGCQGTIAFTSGPSFDIFISPKGEMLWMVQTNSDTVFKGTATRVSELTGVFAAPN
jgi:hypothetical protein